MRVPLNWLKEYVDIKLSPEELAEKLEKGEVDLRDTPFSPVFRLRPPSKGFRSVKEFYPKGDLGYRGKEINDLLRRMI